MSIIDDTDSDIQNVTHFLANHDLTAVVTLGYKLNAEKDDTFEAILTEPDQYIYNYDLVEVPETIKEKFGESTTMLKLKDVANIAMLLAGFGGEMDDILRALIKRDITNKTKLTKTAHDATAEETKNGNRKGDGRKGKKKTKRKGHKTKRKGHKSKKSKKKLKGKRHGKSKKSRKGKKGRK